MNKKRILHYNNFRMVESVVKNIVTPDFKTYFNFAIISVTWHEGWLWWQKEVTQDFVICQNNDCGAPWYFQHDGTWCDSDEMHREVRKYEAEKMVARGTYKVAQTIEELKSSRHEKEFSELVIATVTSTMMEKS